MLTSLSIRDVVLVDVLDLEVDAGLTVLTGETGAGKSIILDALGLALGGRGEAGLVRAGAKQAVATAVFTAPDDAGLIELIQDKGFDVTPGEDLILRRVLSADGRSRAWVNDQPAGVAALREIGALLVEVHGQHETVGLLEDPSRPARRLWGAGPPTGRGRRRRRSAEGRRNAAGGPARRSRRCRGPGRRDHPEPGRSR
jgi:DNA repair protein RecN (Recombination protein N)